MLVSSHLYIQLARNVCFTFTSVSAVKNLLTFSLLNAINRASEVDSGVRYEICNFFIKPSQNALPAFFLLTLNLWATP